MAFASAFDRKHLLHSPSKAGPGFGAFDVFGLFHSTSIIGYLNSQSSQTWFSICTRSTLP